MNGLAVRAIAHGHLGSEFDAADKINARLGGDGSSLIVAREGVVVGDRDRVQARLLGRFDERVRRESPVGLRRMGMQIDQAVKTPIEPEKKRTTIPPRRRGAATINVPVYLRGGRRRCGASDPPE